MRKSRASRRTHRQLTNNSNVVNNAVFASLAASAGPNVHRMWPCTETDPGTTLSSGVGIAVVTPDGGVTPNSGETNEVTDGDTPGTNVRLLQFNAAPALLSSGTLGNPGSADIVLIAVAKARTDPGGPAGSGGEISVYVGDGYNPTRTLSGMRVQPYLAGWSDQRNNNGDTDVTTDIATEYLSNRVEGQTYVFAAVKRGNVLEHWAEGVKTNELDITGYDSTFQDNWADAQFNNSVQCSHSKYDETNAWEYAQDYYGISLHYFTNGVPDDVGEAMLDHKERWPNNDKTIYAGWVSLI